MKESTGSATTRGSTPPRAVWLMLVAVVLGSSTSALVVAQESSRGTLGESGTPGESVRKPGDVPEDATAFQRKLPVPEELDVGLEQKQGAKIPLDITFQDSLGRTRELKDFFGRGRPVLLTLNYFRCPMLCSEQLNALLTGGRAAQNAGRASGLKGLSLTPSVDFDLITVSFDALEGPKLAREKKKTYVSAYGRPAAARGWSFLTGSKASIEALTDAVGFKFKWNAAQKEYSHPSAIVVCTPDGVVSQYLDGLVFESKKIEDALKAASAGEVGSVLHDILLFTCFQYDPASGSYAASAQKIMRTGGILTILAVGILLLTLRRRSVNARSGQVAQNAQGLGVSESRT